MFRKIVNRAKLQLLSVRNYEREMVFGIGLPKTATTSLHSSLQILGYSSIHYPPIARIEDGACYLDWPWWMEMYNAGCDAPVAATYKKLYELYPNAKFVLTTRGLEGWLESCRKHYTEAWAEGTRSNPNLRQAYELDRFMFGSSPIFDRKTFTDTFNRHTDEVVDFFSNRKPLAIIDIPGGHGWNEICSALERNIPLEEFPKRNTRTAPDAAPVDVI